jgi:hypothetical protein
MRRMGRMRRMRNSNKKETHFNIVSRKIVQITESQRNSFESIFANERKINEKNEKRKINRSTILFSEFIGSFLVSVRYKQRKTQFLGRITGSSGRSS